MGISEIVLWSAFLLGLFKSQVFFAIQAVIAVTYAFTLALVYLVGKRFEKRNTIFPNRGWFPQTPNLPSKNSVIREPESKPRKIPKLSWMQAVALCVVIYVCNITFILQPSFMAILLVLLMLVFGITALLLRTKKQIFRVFKYGAILLMLTILVVSSLGFYLFYASGYPSTYVPQTSYLEVLDASILKYLQSVEESASYRFLQVQHVGSIVFTGVSLHSASSNAPEAHGSLEWAFYAKDVSVEISIGQNEGKPYRTHSSTPFRHEPITLPPSYLSEARENLKQVDALGLRWFHDQALEEVQNAIGIKPSITVLIVDIGFDNMDEYEGMTVKVNGRSATYDDRGNNIYPSIFTVKFEPNGHVLSVET